MRVYVAGKFTDWRQVRKVQEILRLAGHVITYDWTEQAEAEELSGVRIIDRSQLIGYAGHDANGVFEANALVLLPHESSKGAYVELGIALGANMQRFRVGIPPIVIVVIGGDKERNYTLFLELPYVQWAEDAEDVLEVLRVHSRAS